MRRGPTRLAIIVVCALGTPAVGAAATWTATSTTAAPTARSQHSAVWTGTEMIVWGGSYWVGGAGGSSVQLNTGAIYDPASDSWEAISTVDAPSARTNHSAVWTGDRMIVWGGLSFNLLGQQDSASR